MSARALLIGLTATLSLTTAATALAQDLGQPGPFAAGFRTVNVTRAAGTTFTARMWYPAPTATANAPFDTAARPAPVVVFGHGFLQTVDRYQSTLAHLATQGFIVIASDSEGSLFPSHQNFANDLSRCFTFVEQQNALASSFLFANADTARYGIAGHSMGGGSALLAASTDPRIDAVATLAAAETNPSATAAIAAVSAPVVLIAGTQDTIVSAAAVTQPMFNAARPVKQYVRIDGAFHCGFEDVSTFGCDSGSMPRATQLAATRRMLTRWFRFYLMQDSTLTPQVWPFVGDSAVGFSGFTSSGISLGTADTILDIRQGGTATVQLTVTNSSPRAQTILLSGSAPLLGSLTIDPPVTPMLAPGETAVIAATIRADLTATRFHLSPRVIAVSGHDGLSMTDRAIIVYVQCAADFDVDGSVTPDDLADFIAAYFSPSPQSPSADFNLDGVTDPDDLADFIARYFSPC